MLRTVSREDLLVSNLVTIPSLPSSTGVKTVQPASEILPSVKISLVPVLAGLEKLSNSANQVSVLVANKVCKRFMKHLSCIPTLLRYCTAGVLACNPTLAEALVSNKY